MSGILNVGTRALQANQIALQTAGNNIANVNTPGYSRQTAVMQTMPGQFSGSGYIGKGVEVSTIERAYSEFLTRQSALAGATSSGDTARAEKLQQLETLFQGGTDGLGAAVSDMLNAFSDVATAPTDLTARTVALTRVSETAQRMSNTATSMDDLQQSLTLELKNKVTSINSLASGIASVNEKIARAVGNGQPPNDLLDQRDQLVRELNQFIQTTSIPATDGTVGIFIGGSQALVLGNTAAKLELGADDFGVQDNKLSLSRNGQTVPLNEATLGGGEVPGLLRFQNTDMAEARNLLGRYAVAITTSMNAQHALGLDLNGNVGGNLFTPMDFSNSVLEPEAPATLNTGVSASNFILAPTPPSGFTSFEATDYDISFTNNTQGTITRRSDGVQKTFDFGVGTSITFDGLTLTSVVDATAAVPISQVPGAASGDRLLLKPFSTSISGISAEFSSPRALAVASPVAGKMGTANTGSLQLTSLDAKTNAVTPPQPAPVVIAFSDPNTYTINGVGPNTYQSGQSIETANWKLVLQGSPKNGDTFTVVGIKDATNNNGIDFKLNSGNAATMMDLRDTKMFDGASLTDGYAGLIAQIGIRSQSASYTAGVSSAIASSLEKDRTAVSGVNLDEEAAKLLQYQQAYQASAKVIQIAQGIFDTLIQTMGR